MKNLNLFTTNKSTVRATAFVPFPALENARQTATAHKAKIGLTADGFFKADCSSAKIAKAIADKLNADYASAVNAKAPKSAPTKPTASKGKAKTDIVTVELNGVKYTVNKADLVPTTPSSTKKTTKKATDTKKTSSSTKAPRKTKGVAFDFGKIKGKDNASKNKALHKELVKIGLKDSRTPEYMSVWNARPWAK